MSARGLFWVKSLWIRCSKLHSRFYLSVVNQSFTIQVRDRDFLTWVTTEKQTQAWEVQALGAGQCLDVDYVLSTVRGHLTGRWTDRTEAGRLKNRDQRRGDFCITRKKSSNWYGVPPWSDPKGNRLWKPVWRLGRNYTDVGNNTLLLNNTQDCCFVHEGRQRMLTLSVLVRWLMFHDEKMKTATGLEAGWTGRYKRIRKTPIVVVLLKKVRSEYYICCEELDDWLRISRVQTIFWSFYGLHFECGCWVAIGRVIEVCTTSTWITT